MIAWRRAAAAEVVKLRTTRMWWILALVMVVYVALMAGGLGAFFGWLITDEAAGAGGEGNAGLPSTSTIAPLIYSFATSIGYVFPVLIGALAVTGEFRHQTLTPTFLVTPRRGVALGAKLAVLLGVGALFGVLAFAASILPGAGALAGFGLDAQLGSADTWALVGRGVIAMALWAAIGVGLGALVPNQVASIVIVIAFTQFLEPVVRIVAAFSEVTGSIAQFLPGAASDALVGSSFYSSMGMGMATGPTLEAWQGGLVLLAYAVLTTAAGYLTSWRKDVT